MLSLLTALPALLVSHVRGLGPNGVLDLVTTNSQKFLEGKWSHLFHVACSLHERFSSPPASAPSSNEERQHRMVRQLVRGGSLSAAYQRLTQPGLYPADPRARFLELEFKFIVMAILLPHQ